MNHPAEPNFIMADQVFDNSEIEFDDDESDEELRPASAGFSTTKVTIKQAEG